MPWRRSRASSGRLNSIEADASVRGRPGSTGYWAPGRLPGHDDEMTSPVESPDVRPISNLRSILVRRWRHRPMRGLDPEDLAQEVLMRAWFWCVEHDVHAQERLTEDPVLPRRLVLAVARRVELESIRRLRRLKCLAIDSGVSVEACQAPDRQWGDDPAPQQRVHEFVMHLCRRALLSSADRRLLELIGLGLSSAEISNQSGLSVAAVDSRRRRLLDSLRGRLREFLPSVAARCGGGARSLALPVETAVPKPIFAVGVTAVRGVPSSAGHGC